MDESQQDTDAGFIAWLLDNPGYLTVFALEGK